MFVTNWISTTKIQKISEITNFFRHYFLSRTEVVMFDSPRNTVPGKTFKVFQVFSDGSALSSGDDSSDNNFGLVVLFLGDESTSYYDDQKIEIPKGKVARQIGNYSYTTNMG